MHDAHGKFLPATTEEEFLRRAADIQLPAARSVLSSLQERRKALTASLDAEIDFYEKVIALKEKEAES